MKTILLSITAAFFSIYYLPKTDLVISPSAELAHTSNPFSLVPMPSASVPKADIFTPNNPTLGQKAMASLAGVWGNSDFSADPELITSYKAKVVKSVFDKLKNAKGDFRSRRPYLRFVDQTGGGVAVAYPKMGLIMLEEKGYDICVSFGKDSLNALAAFLSHELVHCYEKHDWEEYFASEFRGNGLGGEVSDDAKADEIQADYLGGFLSYQAGFKPFGIMPQFLDKVYEAYGLTDEKLSKYPKKAERKSISIESEEKLKKLLDLFEMANFLVALEEYDDALEYYYKVLEDFQSREIYNNLGVLSTLSAIKRFAPTENIYAFPVELDVESRMRTGSRGDNGKDFREEKLIEAIDFFEKARQYDSFYSIAYLNQGCAHALLGISQHDFSALEWQDAESAALRAIRIAKDDPDSKTTLVNAKVLLGILSALKKDTTESKQHFEEALNLDSTHFLAKSNFNTLMGIKNPIPPFSRASLENEVIDNQPFNSLRLNADNKKGDILSDEDYTLVLLGKAYDNSFILANASVKGTGSNRVKKNTYLHYTGPAYSQPTSKGVTIGDKLAKVIEAENYGEPQSRMSLGNGTFLRYIQDATTGVIFQFNAENKLTRWCIYRQQRG